MRRPEFQRKDAETRRRKKAKKENEDFYFLVLLPGIFAPLRLRALALNSALFSDSLLVRTALASLSLSTAPLRRGSRRALPRQICDLERGGSQSLFSRRRERPEAREAEGGVLQHADRGRPTTRGAQQPAKQALRSVLHTLWST